MISFQPTDIVRVLPEIILAAFGTLVMVFEPFLSLQRKPLLGWFAIFGVASAGAAAIRTSFSPGMAFGGTVAADRFSLFFTFLFLLVAVLTLLGSMNYLERDRMQHGEFHALILMGTAGMCFMAASTDLIMIFLGLEISSLSTYVLAGFRRRETQSVEASLKYFLLGSFATAFFLYGIAFVYGLTGTTNLIALSDRLRTPSAWSSFARAALVLMFVGLGFKASTVPFQVWTPDVYQGAPAPVTAFLSVGPKAAAFAVLLRIFLGGMAAASHLSFWLIWLSAALTMTFGNLAALAQSNLKRMLAYSSIAHAGYVLVGVTAAINSGSSEGLSAVLFYLVAYSLMNVAAFVLLAHLAGPGERRTWIADYVGLAYQRPGVAACWTLLLLSLAGFPATVGFLGKFYLFRSAVHSQLIGLAVVAVLNSVVSVYYYLKLVVAMYMQEGETSTLALSLPLPLRISLVVSVIGIFYFGLFPNQLASLTHLAAIPLP